jgi:MacB-like periplasmic core domain
VVVLGYSFWRRRFAGSEEALGKSLILDNESYTIIGVLLSNYQLLVPSDVYIPFEPWAKTLPDDRNWHPGITAVARLRDGVSLGEAQSEMKTIAANLAQAYPTYDTDMGARDLDARPSGLQRTAGIAGDARSGRAGVADRLRQHRQPVARKGNGAPSGNRSAQRDGRVAGSADAPITDGMRFACAGGRRHRPFFSVVLHELVA